MFDGKVDETSFKSKLVSSKRFNATFDCVNGKFRSWNFGVAGFVSEIGEEGNVLHLWIYTFPDWKKQRKNI